MAMKAELAELRAFKATTTPAATTGAAHTGGKRARVQQDRLPKLRTSGELPAPSATFNSGEKVRELSVSNRAGQEIFINTMSVARSQTPVQAAQNPSTWQKSPSERHKNKGDESS